MNLDDVRDRCNRGNKILFSRDSPCLQELLCQIRLQTHRTLVLWAFTCVREPVRLLKERYPNDTRPQTAVAMCEDWASGKVKMAVGKKALLEAHAMAKELTNLTDIALCHAVGQACATVHVETHAIGLPIYELTALVREHGIENAQPFVKERISQYLLCLNKCAQTAEETPQRWASFLCDDSRPNKEQLLFERTRQS